MNHLITTVIALALSSTSVIAQEGYDENLSDYSSTDQYGTYPGWRGGPMMGGRGPMMGRGGPMMNPQMMQRMQAMHQQRGQGGYPAGMPGPMMQAQMDRMQRIEERLEKIESQLSELLSRQ